MTTSPSSAALSALHARTAALQRLHEGRALLVLANVWDAATARRVEAAGFPAIATTSGGVAQSLGYEDHEQAPLEEMLAAATRIARAVSVPVTVDFERGYGLAPQVIVERLVAAGASGLNLEDTDHRGGGLFDADRQAEFLGQVRAATTAAGIPLVLNARIDVYLQREGTPEQQREESVRRARLYREAGADCVYPILLADPEGVRALVAAAQTVNLFVRRGGPLSLDAARSLGVRRVSYATSLFREAQAAFDAALAEIGGAGAS